MLEKVIDGKSGTVLLTELGILAMDSPSYPAIGFLTAGDPSNLPTVGAWDEPAMIQMEDSFRLGNNGPLIKMVDGPPSSNLEVPRDMVWRTNPECPRKPRHQGVCFPRPGGDKGLHPHRVNQRRADYPFRGRGEG
jgi:hypothetical protein